MKSNIRPINREVAVPRDKFIVSKTDLKGRISYVNRVFMEVADYSEVQLLGRPHNVIRHPDMPRGVFRLLWETLQREQEFFGFVKNMTASGAYYWVFANITPDRDEAGRIQGYYSVRRAAPPSAIAVVVPLYADLLNVERAAGPAEAPDASVRRLHERLAAIGKSYEQFALELFSS